MPRPSIGRATDITRRKRGADAAEWAYNCYIKGNPERGASFEEACRQSDLAQQIYDIRHKICMTRENLAEFSGFTPEAIEDLEKSDYDGDWNEAIDKINSAFRQEKKRRHSSFPARILAILSAKTIVSCEWEREERKANRSRYEMTEIPICQA